MSSAEINSTKRKSNPWVSLAAVFVISTTLTSGCGNKTDLGADVGLSVIPGSDALILPASTASCVDYTAYYSSSDAGTTLTYSVSGPSIFFNTFQLQWSSSDNLYLISIRYSVTSPSIANGKYIGDLSSAEVEALVGKAGRVIVGEKDASGNPKVQLFSSTSKTKDVVNNTRFAPCGLAIGGIPLKNPKSDTPFTAQLILEFIGTREDSNHNLNLVIQTYKTTARYLGSGNL